jgi:RHS repeat-associated protein
LRFTNGRTTTQGYSGNDVVRQKFTGYENDAETGLNFPQARYQSSMEGRFTSPDPILSSSIPTNPQTWNKYIYCLNNPLANVDPTGTWNWLAYEGGGRSQKPHAGL